MIPIRQRIESWFEGLSRLVFRRRITALLLMLSLTAVAAVFLPRITIDTTNESFFRKNDAVLVDYNSFKDEFGKDELFVVAIRTPDVFDAVFLKRLRELHGELKERVPYLDDITSLINARDTRGEGDVLVVEDLMQRWPRTKADRQALRERALANPLYRDLLLTEDGTFATVILKAKTYLPEQDTDALGGFDDGQSPDRSVDGRVYLTNPQNSEMIAVIRDVLTRYDAPEFRTYLAGAPVVVADIEAGIDRTLKTMIPLSLLMVVLFLAIMFRRASGVFYPMLTMVLSLLATFGLMAATGLPITHVTQILPTFLLVVGVADAVHILAIFFLRYDEGAGKEDAMAYAMGHSALAVLMTSLTTAAGLLSFTSADVAPIVDMGLIAPLGVVIALGYTVILVPALIALLPVRRKARAASGGERVPCMDRMLAWIADVSCRRPWRIIAVSLVCVVLSLGGIAKLRFSHNGLLWLPDDYPVRTATEIIDEKLKGAVTLEIVIDTGRDNGLHDPEFLQRLDDAVRHFSGYRLGGLQVGKAWTITAILKEIHQALNENRPAFYALPDSRELAAQEFLLFEGSGSDDLEEVVDASYRKVRFTIKSPFHDAIVYKRFLDEIRAYFEEHFPGSRVVATGVMALFAGMIHNVITTMAKSYLIALTVITLLMVLLIGRVRIGMLSMVPNLIPIMMVMGIMGWLDITLDLSTSLIGSIAIGLVVDDTIHFMHNFRRYVERTGDVVSAVRSTMLTTGRAIMITSVVLSAGFFITMTAEMKNTVTFGLLTGTSVVFALAADYFLTPALMMVVYRNRKVPGVPRQAGSGEGRP